MQNYSQCNVSCDFSLLKQIGWLLAVLLAAGTMAACSPRQLMVKEMTVLMEDGVKGFETDSDLKMLQQALPAHIKLAEAILIQDPENAALRVLLAQLYGSYAFAFEETDFERHYYAGGGQGPGNAAKFDLAEMAQNLSSHYMKGAEYAKSTLILKYPDADKNMGNVSQRQPFLASLDREDVPALFWYGFNLAGYVNRNLNSVKAMALASQVEAAMQRVIELFPSYYHGTAHMVMMVFNAARPAMLGGRLDTAQQHHRLLAKIAGDDFHLNDVLYARYCLPRMQAKADFEKLLTPLIENPVIPSDPYALFNQVARERAKIYLDAADQLFGE